MLELIQYQFFQNALIGGILISLIASILWVFVIMRKEANITHSISNFLFLGIAISLLLHWNYYVFAFLFSIIWSSLIFIIDKTWFITKESTREIISQVWLAFGIFAISFLDSLSLDIFNLLFGSILFINYTDIIILTSLLVLFSLFLFFFGRNFLSVIINEDIAKINWINVPYYNFFFLIFLSFFIAIWIKIFWILLIGVFLIIPVNIAKILSPSLKWIFIISVISSVLSVILGLFFSYFVWASSSGSIVIFLVLFLFLSIIWNKYNYLLNK